METIKRAQHGLYEVLYFITDRFPGLFALLITLAIFGIVVINHTHLAATEV